PITREWTRKPLEVAEIGKVLSKDPHLNIGVVTGKLSGIVAIDIDQPQIVGFNPESAMKKGALAHTTSKAHRLVFRSNNPEVLASKKITRKWTDLTEKEKEKVVDREKYEKEFKELRKQLEEGKITEKEFERKVPVITLIEVLGDGRQFLAPPSVHPEKGVKFGWITPLPESSEAILEVKNLDELKNVLWECVENKEVLFELFEKERLEQTRKFSKDVLEEWFETIREELDEAKDHGSYVTFHCPFHPPDEHPSFAIYRNTFLAIDFHDGKVYTLKELAEALDIKLPVKKTTTIEFREFKAISEIRQGKIFVKFQNDGNETVPVCIGAIDSDWMPKDAPSNVKAALESIGVRVKRGEPRRLIMQIKAELGNLAGNLTKSLIKELGNERVARSQADKLVELVLATCAKLFTNEHGEAYVAIKHGNAIEALPIRSNAFKRLLGYLFYKHEGKTPSNEVLTSALNTLEGIALYEGEKIKLSVRVAGDEKAIYIDTGDGEWNIIEITADGWRIIPHSQIVFKRSNITKPLVKPAEIGDIELIWKYCRIRQEDRLLFLAAVISFFVPGIPHPIVVIYGREGRNKSSCCRVIRKLIDPLSIEFQRFPKDEREAAIIFSSRWLIVLDNVSEIPQWLSDFLCRAVTGEGFETRELYTDKDTVPFTYRRCIVINGIYVPTLRPDAIDRCLFFETKAIPDEERKEERELWREFEKDAPFILKAILDALCKAIALLPQVRAELRRLPRMADFCVWGEAIARALGYAPLEFYNAYMGKIKQQKVEAVEKSIVGELLLAFMKDKQEWKGEPSELFAELRKLADMLQVKRFPKTPQHFSLELSRIEESLKGVGLIIEKGRESDRTRSRWIRLTWSSEKHSPPKGGEIVESSSTSSEPIEYVTIKVVKLPPVSEFYGVDGRIYKVEEVNKVLTLPEPNARPLLEKGYALRMGFSK
ncbi:hypothetical protein DRP04_08985, partial [Archaeoglobales archaeon]